MDRSNIDKIAQTPEDRILLAKLWDKIQSGLRKNIPSNTGFLSPREQAMAQYLLGNAEGLYAFGGYEDAERRIYAFLPDYLDRQALYDTDSPITCLRAEFYTGDTPGHRDFLGALMGAGITRESVGDIFVGIGTCDFFVTAEIAPYLLQNFTSVGRTKIRLSKIPLCDAKITEPEFAEIRDTVSSVRLDSVISTGFRISRSKAADYISAGCVAINGLPCEKPDKTILPDTKISVRGLGKIKLASIGGQTKKGRTAIIIHQYI